MAEPNQAIAVKVGKDAFGPVYRFVCPACTRADTVRAGGTFLCVCGATIHFRECDAATSVAAAAQPVFEAQLPGVEGVQADKPAEQGH